MNLMTLFEKNVKDFPNAPAISMSKRNETWTYLDLDKKVKQVSSCLKEQGVNKGDGVLILVPMSFELYASLLALFKIGAVAVFIDPQSSKKHIKSCIEKYPLKGFIGVKKAHLLRLLNKDIRRIPLMVTIGYLPFTKDFNKFTKINENLKEYETVNNEDPALITFTSGSTGKPKAAVRTHEFLLKQYEVLSKNMLFDKGEVDVSTLPVFVLANLASGMHSVIPDVNLLNPSEVNGLKILEDVKKYKATRFGGSPVLVNKISEHLSDDGQMTSLTHIYMGGGPVYPSVLHGLQMKLPSAKVFGLYGSTEAEPIAHMSSDEYDYEKVLATKNYEGLYVGKKISEIDIKIINSDNLTDGMEDFSQVECEKGEIIVSGEHVLKGYLNGEGDRENKIHMNGKVWHRTGDAGYFDDDGGLWLLGRYGQKIKSYGKVYYPFAIESSMFERGYKTALISHNNQACLVVEGEKPTEDILFSLGIEKVIVVKEIPRDKRHNSKVDYETLKNLLKQF